MKTDILIVGCGVAGLYAALNLPQNRQILIITKSDAESSDSFLAQGGICVLKDEDDYNAFFEDTMKAGHYENNKESVDIMIRSSRDVIQDLIRYGVDFTQKDGQLCYTREGAHSTNRILYHDRHYRRGNYQQTSRPCKRTGKCNADGIGTTRMGRSSWKRTENALGIVANASGEVFPIWADCTLLACGGIGGLYQHLQKFSPPYRGRSGGMPETSCGTSASRLHPDTPHNLLFCQTGTAISHFRIGARRRRFAL